MRTLRWQALSTRLLLLSGSLALILAILAGCDLFNPPPQPEFTWDPLEPLARNEVRFTDLSDDEGGIFGGAGISTWTWDFGDGTTSAARNPVHRYRCEGEYMVTLTVTDSGGLSRSISHQVNVQPSLHGLWKGKLWDALDRSFDLELELYQSTPGSITGTAYVNGLACNIINASFDPVGKKVSISFAYWGTGNTWLLVGDYEAYPGCERIRISGYWENISIQPGKKIGDWEVQLQPIGVSEERDEDL